MMRLTGEALKARIKELEEQQMTVGAELRALTNEATIRFELPEKRKMIGKCFKFRNNYSCPKSEEDYWWLYTKIIDVTDDGVFIFEKFEKSSTGITALRSGEGLYSFSLEGYIPITPKEYKKAKKEILKNFEEK